MAEAARAWVSYADYLVMEAESEQRHEWFDGQVFAMAGGTLPHAELSAAMIGELRALARACGCRVFSADAKVRVLATGLGTYPDASVVCGPVQRDPDDRHAMTNPAVLVEVLSDGTEAYDRGDKFLHYRQIPTLRDVVFVSQHARRIEVFSRDAEGRWLFREAGEGETVAVSALNAVIDVDRVYQDVELVPAPLRAV